MYRDLTRGSILRSLLLFALPMLAGDILQQLYNIADTLIVSRAIGRDALAHLTSGTLGVAGIWAAIPIGWVLADVTGAVYYFGKRKALLPEMGQ